MSIKNLIKNLFSLIIISVCSTEISARGEHPWTYNLEKGKKQYAAGMYTFAYDSMRMVLKKNPMSYEAANVLGYISLINKDIHSAEEYFQRSLEINDSQPEIHTEIGKVNEYFQRDDSAMSHYTKSVSLDPGNTGALINLARIHFKKGMISEGDRYFRLCYDIGIRNSGEIYRRAEELRKKNPNAAIPEFQKAIKINPAHSAAYIGLADSYRQKNLYDKAIEILEELKKNRPDYLPAYIYLGNIYFNNKPAKERRKYYIDLSISNFEKAIELAPENTDLYFQLSGIYRATGNREKAEKLDSIIQNMLGGGR